MPTTPTTDFASLGVPASLDAVLADAGIRTPTPIQSATLADSLAGRDVLARGKTGSGKTYGFSIPLVARIAAGPQRRGRDRTPRPRGLVLAPTRELARQIDETLAPLAQAAGLTTTVVFGGVSASRQISAFERGVDIVVACPGRLEDLIGQRALSLDSVQVTVLDEADHMADLGFLPAVRRLLRQTPTDGQRLLFSATLDNAVDTLAEQFLRDPVRHSADSVVATPGPTEHHLVTVQHDDRVRVIAALAAAHHRTVVFTRTKHGARRLAKQLTTAGVPSVDLHGNLAQNARVRNLEAFSSGAAPALVATDIAARGIHVDDVDLVVHADPPAEHKAYVHRSGRTARAGAVGTVVTVAERGQHQELRSVFRSAGVKPTETTVAVGDVVRLGGGAALEPVARAVVPAAPSAPATGGQNQGGRRQGGQEQGGRRQGGLEQGGRGQSGRQQSGQQRGGRDQGGRRQGAQGQSTQGRGAQGRGAQGQSTPGQSTPGQAGAPQAGSARAGGPRGRRRATAPAGAPRGANASGAGQAASHGRPSGGVEGSGQRRRQGRRRATRG